MAIAKTAQQIGVRWNGSTDYPYSSSVNTTPQTQRDRSDDSVSFSDR